MSEAWAQLDTPTWLSGGADLWDDGPAGELLLGPFLGTPDVPPVLPRGIGTGHAFSSFAFMGGRAIWSPTGTYLEMDGVLEGAGQIAAPSELIVTTSGALSAAAALSAFIELQLVAMPWPGETYFGGIAVIDTAVAATAAVADLCEARAVSQYYQEPA